MPRSGRFGQGSDVTGQGLDVTSPEQKFGLLSVVCLSANRGLCLYSGGRQADPAQFSETSTLHAPQKSGCLADEIALALRRMTRQNRDPRRSGRRKRDREDADA
jgi:hypothetical protein